MLKPLHRLSPGDAALATDVMSALRRMRRFDPKMSLEELYVLLAVASRPGVTQKELGEELELQTGPMSRVCDPLGDYREGGLKFITQGVDPKDRRSRPMQPLPAGVEAVRDALRDIKGGLRHGNTGEGE